MVWEEIIKLAVGNGLWAVLFCALLFYELKDSRKREGKYVETISTLGERLDTVNSVKEDTERILSVCEESRNYTNCIIDKNYTDCITDKNDKNYTKRIIKRSEGGKGV